jgi:hypothetical protein
MTTSPQPLTRSQIAIPMTREAARRALQTDGILLTDDLFSREELRTFQSILDPLFERKVGEARAYAHPDELLDAGLWPLVFSEKMRSLLFSLMPDPVLYHCHVYEIAGGNPEPHIFGESLAGWHCDVDQQSASDGPTHISLFVYLTDVGPDSGAFEFVPHTGRQWLRPRAPFISAFGKAGHTFVWNREFFHRAAPNLSPVRRRLLKLSIQRNRYPSTHLANEHFQKVLRTITPGDAGMDILLGRYQSATPPRLPLSDLIPAWYRISPNSRLNLPVWGLLAVQLRKRLSVLKRKIIGVERVPEKAIARG